MVEKVDNCKLSFANCFLPPANFSLAFEKSGLKPPVSICIKAGEKRILKYSDQFRYYV
jgi:hypothetical protein